MQKVRILLLVVVDLGTLYPHARKQRPLKRKRFRESMRNGRDKHIGNQWFI